MGKKRIIQIRVNEYTPIRSLLKKAIRDFSTYQDQYIKVMVSDAISLSRDVGFRTQANGRLFRYSSYLSNHYMTVVNGMNPDSLTRDDYQRLYEIFEVL